MSVANQAILAFAIVTCLFSHNSRIVASEPIVEGVTRVSLVVDDLDRSLDFYSKVLTFTKTAESEVTGHDLERLSGVFGARIRTAKLTLGTEEIELVEYLSPPGRRIPEDSRSQDRWFQHLAIVVSDMTAAYERLRKFRVEHASSGPQRLPDWNPNAAGIEAFYFRDPDHHTLEIIRFPTGKGLPRWHEPTNRLFLGIDHTAIVVSSTEESLAFYRDMLGMRVTGTSENFGDEQEHLNNVFGARLRITSLRAASGPGVELLEYLTPRDGRMRPMDARPNDLIHWKTHFRAKDEAALHSLAQPLRRNWISPGEVRLSDRETRTAALHAQDDDGHALMIETSAPISTAQGAR